MNECSYEKEKKKSPNQQQVDVTGLRGLEIKFITGLRYCLSGNIKNFNGGN